MTKAFIDFKPLLRDLAVTMLSLLTLGLLCCCNDDRLSPQQMTLSSRLLLLQKGDTVRIIVTIVPQGAKAQLRFKSLNETIARVDASGLVTALGPGETSIVVEAGSLREVCQVKVLPHSSSQDVRLTLLDKEVSIAEGDSMLIRYTVVPEETPVTFISAEPQVASVDAKGCVKGMSIGQTNVTLQVDTVQAIVMVSVIAPKVTVPAELPLMKFAPQRDATGHITDPSVLAHEQSLGRRSQSIRYNIQQTYEGFVGLDLTTIPAVIYGIPTEDGRGKRILAYGKETIDHCPRIRTMLQHCGFSHIESAVIDVAGEETPVLRATHDIDSDITVVMMDEEYPEFGAQMYIEFAQHSPKHSKILTTVRDFPSLKDLATGSLEMVQAYEQKLGLRQLSEVDSKSYSRMFVTTSQSMERSNLKWVYYTMREEPSHPFINAELNCPNGRLDVKSAELKEYLAYNGFDYEYYADPSMDVVMVYNHDGDMCQIFEDPKTKRILLQLVLKRDLPNPVNTD